jgi:PAS domain S-box-containing protein
MAALGIIVLTGWALDIDALKSVFPGLVTMKANTALANLFSGLAFAFLSREKVTRRFRFAAVIMAWAVLAISALTLGEYLFGWDLGIDQWLFHDLPGTVGTSQPGRMSPATAFCFVLIGSALLASARPAQVRSRLPLMAALGVAVIVVGGLALVGYGSETLLSARWWNYTGMAIHTAAGFIALGLILLALVKSEGGLAWALDKSVTTGFVAAIAVMLIAAAVTYNLMDKTVDASKWVAHTQEVLKEIKVLAAGMAELESGQRGYIITGDELALAGRAEIENAVRQHLAEVRQLTSDNPHQQRRLDRLEPLIAQRNDFGDQTIVARRQRGFAVAEQMIANGTGIVLSDKIQLLLQQMEAEEYALLDQRQKESTLASTAAFLVLPLGVFLSMTMLSVGLFLLNAGVDERKQAEALAARLAAIVEFSDDAIIGKDLQGVVTSWNLGAERIFGYSAAEMVGQPITRLIPPDRQPEETEILTRLRRGENVRHFETVRLRKDGRPIDISVTVSPIKDDRGRVIGASKVARDITERRLAETQLRASLKEVSDLQAALDEHAIVAMTDPQGRITYVNDKFCAISKYSSDELLGQDHRIINSGHHPKEFIRDLWTAIAHGHAWHGEIKNRAKDGSFYWVDTTVVPFLNEQGKPRQYVAIRTDITERKVAEEKIHELNTSLEQRVVERTAQLEAANKELEAFSYSVSHDLRAPLRAVDGFSQAVVEDYGPQLPEEGQRYLRTIREGAQRMGTLIDDLLTFSRLSRQPANRQPVDTGKLVREILEELNPRSPDRQVEIRLGDLPPCQGDAALVRQVWVNLLSNAFKYTRQREVAIVDIGCAHEAGANVYYVRDNGTGFDMKYAHKLFGVFQRLHRAEDYEGTGVGLAIVQRVVHRHGGRVWAEAALDRGATFYFTLEEETKS